MPLIVTKSKQVIFRIEKGQGHKITEPGLILEGFIKRVCILNIKFLSMYAKDEVWSTYGSTLMVKIKVFAKNSQRKTCQKLNVQ